MFQHHVGILPPLFANYFTENAILCVTVILDLKYDYWPEICMTDIRQSIHC